MENQKMEENMDEIKLHENSDEKNDIIKDYENTLKRLQADFENYIKRSQKEKEEYSKLVLAKALAKFVDIMDDLDRTLNILEKTDNDEVKAGIQMVHKRFHKILQEEGIESFISLGEKTDPYKHDVIDMVEHVSPEGTIIEEVQKGYTWKDKILRAAKVRVSRGKEEEK